METCGSGAKMENVSETPENLSSSMPLPGKLQSVLQFIVYILLV